MLLYCLSGLLGLILGSVICWIILWSHDERKQHYRDSLEQYLNAEQILYNHIREHVIREKDLTWAAGLPQIVTFGIKSDGTLMTNEEIEEARHSVVGEEKDGLVRWAQGLI